MIVAYTFFYSCSYSAFPFSDIIFFIYLYQRWIYRIDPKRVNEFGVSQEMMEETKKPETKELKEKEEDDEKDKDESTPAANGEGSGATKESNGTANVRQRKGKHAATAAATASS